MAETALLSIAHNNINNTTNTATNNDLTQTMVKLLSHWQDFQSRASQVQQPQSQQRQQGSDADRPAASKGLPPSLKNLLNNSNDSSFELRHLLPATTTVGSNSVDHKDNSNNAQAPADDKSSRRRSRTSAARERPEASAGTSNWSATTYPANAMNVYLQDSSRQLHRPVPVRPGSSHPFASLALAASSCPSSPTSSSARGFSSPIASPPNPSTPEFAPVNPFGGQKQVRWDESETRSRSSSLDCSSPHSHSPSPPAGSKKRELIFCTIFSESDLNGDKPKQKRRRKEQTQLEILEEVFKKDPLPSRKTKERLAQDVGLPHRAVQVWFQNRRAKERRSLRDQGVSESTAAMPNPWAKAE